MSLKGQVSYLPQRVVPGSKDLICESNWKLRQAVGNSRCHLENRVLCSLRQHILESQVVTRVRGALGTRDEFVINFSSEELTV